MKLTLIDYFEEVYKKSPGKTAIIEANGSKSIDYNHLSSESKKLSSIISSRLNSNYKFPIAVFLKKSINCILSDIAIMQSGNFFMNLDVKTPIARIDLILKQIKPKLIITNDEYAGLLSEVWSLHDIINLDKIDNSKVPDNYNQYKSPRLIDTDPMCIINTSGTTGRPKGVVLNHRSYISFAKWAVSEKFVSENDVMGSLSPAVFDLYCFELSMLLMKGCTIVILDEKMSAFPVKLLESLIDYNVTFIFWVPTIMVNIANLNILDKLPLKSLKTIWFAGEVFPTKQFNVWRKSLPQSTFVNLYGPIETTVIVTYYVVDRDLDDNEPIPIGSPVKNTDILILNENNEIPNVGEEGELCVRGTQLGMGYYNDPIKTKENFVQNPLNNSYPESIYRTGDIAKWNSNGELIFVGRKDSLIKHLGYRIELNEIEHVIINSLRLAENCCAVYDNNKKEIVLYYESKENISEADMRIRISKKLPKYMIPAKYIRVNAMPRNTNGKIDRLSLTKKLNEGN